jgi:hypothetical protein
VAAQYIPPHRYLIGPRLFDVYLIVVLAVAGSLSLAFLVILPLITALGEADILAALGSCYVEILGDYFGILLTTYGAVTLSFAILERVLPGADWRDDKDDASWDPRQLPVIEDHARISLGEIITGSCFLIILLVMFNFFPQLIGVHVFVSVNGGPVAWYSVPFLADTFFSTYLPLLNILWLVNIGLNVLLLRQGRWRVFTRLIDLGMTIFGAYICYYALSGPPILSTAPAELEAFDLLLRTIFPPMLQIGLLIVLVVSIASAAHKVYKLIVKSNWRIKRA